MSSRISAMPDQSWLVMRPHRRAHAYCYRLMGVHVWDAMGAADMILDARLMVLNTQIGHLECDSLTVGRVRVNLRDEPIY